MTDLRKKRILFVSDNPEYQMPIIEELEEIGYEVIVADQTRGVAVDTAINTLKDAPPPDLVITKMYMACGLQHLDLVDTYNGWNTGLAFVRHMREEGCKVPFLFLDIPTGYSYCRNLMQADSLLAFNGEQIPYCDSSSFNSIIRKIKSIIGPPESRSPGNIPARIIPRGIEPA